MGYQQRCDLYRRIGEIRGKPLIAYMTSRRQFNGGILSMDAIFEFCEHIRNIPADVDEVDLLISSQGGDPIAAWRIVSLLRERFKKVSVLIPYNAQSAATVLVLGADEILMHPFSYLGPIDVQMSMPPNEPNGMPRMFSTKDISSYIDFLKEDLRIKDGDLGSIASESFLEEFSPSEIGAIKKSMVFIESIATKLLETHIDDEDSVKEIVDKFTGFSHHGYTVGRKEAIDLKLPVLPELDKELEELIWTVWDDAEREMKCREVFDPMLIISQDDGVMKRLFVSPERQKKSGDKNIEKVEDITIVSLVESLGLRSHYDTKAIISAYRENNLNIAVNVNFVPLGWVTERMDG